MDPQETLNEDTGMWAVEPEVLNNSSVNSSMIHLDSVVCLAHLLPIYGDEPAPGRHCLNYTRPLDTSPPFYVNKYADHHAFEIASQ